MFLDNFASYEEALAAWDEGAAQAAITHPLQSNTFRGESIEALPKKTARFLELKSLYWMIRRDKGLQLIKEVLLKPWFHLCRYVSACCGKPIFRKDSDFYFFGIRDEEEWKEKALLSTSKVVVGFSYCEKPLECPVKRFSSQCIFDPNHSICRQCFIGKCCNFLPRDKVVTLIIPTVHDVGRELFALSRKNPDKELLFCITACPLSLHMFSKFGHMAGFKGIGVALKGRTCNTIRAFQMAEDGIKPQRTDISEEGKRRLLSLFRIFRSGS